MLGRRRSGFICLMVKQLIFILLISLTSEVFAQVPTDQDCLGAIPVCQDTYYQQNSYSGTGNYPNEIPTGGGCPGNCLLVGERNDVWYIFTVQTSGDLGFTLSPNNYSDDYDWAVYSLNDYKCQDIYLHAAEMQVSCNYSADDGDTGPNGMSNMHCQNSSGSAFNDMIPVEAGDTYVINISNYSSTQFGYLLDFTISTAEIFDDVPPELDVVETEGLDCGIENLTFDFTEKVRCSTIQPNDFQLSGPGGPYEISAVFGEACDVGGEMEKTFTITFSPAIFQGGSFSLDILPLSFIQDNCGNSAFPQSLEFELDLASFLVDAGDDQEIPFLGTAELDGYVDGGSGDYTFSWEPAEKLEDPTLEDPTTIPLIETTVFLLEVTDNTNSCVSTDDVTVKIVGGEMSLNISGNPAIICEGESTLLDVTPSGGSGNYTYEWSSVPTGFTSNIKTPTAYPVVTTTYKVIVDDGYSTISAEVIITVNPKPLADAGTDQEINQGTFTQLEGSGTIGTPPYTFLWEPSAMIDGSNTISDPMTVVLMDPQNYTLRITDDKSCESDISTVLINTVGEVLSAFPQATPKEICYGGITTLKANATGGGGNYTYNWTSSEAGWSATGDNIKVNPLETTTYFVEVNDGFSSYSVHIVVPVLPLPEINLMPDGYIEYGDDTIVACVRDTIILDAGDENNPPAMEYLWSNNWAGQYNIAKTNGNWFDMQTHTVHVKNPVTTCSNEASITVVFDFNACSIGIEESVSEEMPVIVHPNPGEGVFFMQSAEPIQKLEIKLLSIQGTLISEFTYLDIPAGGWKKPLDISNMNNGIYLLWISADGLGSVIKLIKH